MNGYARRGTLISMIRILDRYPTVLLPVSAEQAFEQDADIASVEGMRRVMAAQASMMAIPVLGFPALSVPTGVAGNLPTGVQLLGRRFDEDGILDAAQVISPAGRSHPSTLAEVSRGGHHGAGWWPPRVQLRSDAVLGCRRGACRADGPLGTRPGAGVVPGVERGGRSHPPRSRFGLIRVAWLTEREGVIALAIHSAP